MTAHYQFRPLNEDHAIESVKFAIIFSSGITPQSILAIEANHDNWRDGLPARSIADVDFENAGRKGKAPGVMFAFVRPDASPSWSMTVAANKVEVECFLYSRWERVWSTSKEYFVKALSILSEVQPELFVGALELTVKDVFATDEEYTLENLLTRSEYLPQFLFRAGQFWHCNSGWFEPSEVPERVLHNLNCDAAPNGDETYVSISHYQQKNLVSGLKITDLVGEAFKPVDAGMAALHEMNKAVVLELFTQETARRIGLGN